MDFGAHLRTVCPIGSHSLSASAINRERKDNKKGSLAHQDLSARTVAESLSRYEWKDHQAHQTVRAYLEGTSLGFTLAPSITQTPVHSFSISMCATSITSRFLNKGQSNTRLSYSPPSPPT